MHDGKGSMMVRERWLILSANFHDSISLLFNPRGICLCTKWPFSLEIVQRTQQHHIQRLSPSPTPFPSSTRHPRDLKPNHGLNRAAKLSRSVLQIKTVSESELRECEYQCCPLPPPWPPNLPAMNGNKNTISSNKGQNQIMNKSSSSMISPWQRETDVVLRPSISAVKDDLMSLCGMSVSHTHI